MNLQARHFVFAALLFVSGAQAEHETHVWCDTGGHWENDDTACSISDDWGAVAASVYAEDLLLQGRASAATGEKGIQPGAVGRAYFLDTITINSPGLTGELGVITVGLVPRWILGVWGNAYATGRCVLEVNGEQLTSSERTQELRSGVYTETALNDGIAVPYQSRMTATTQFKFGDRFQIYVELTFSAWAWQASASSTEASPRPYGCFWGGIRSVTYQGNAISYTVQSDSGADYRKSKTPYY